MTIEAAFIFVAPQADSTAHRTVVETPVIRLSVVGVKDYADAVAVARDLAAKGVKAIELCGGFGVEGAALVAKAVKGLATVGVVRFDAHPGLDFKSGDTLFQ